MFPKLVSIRLNNFIKLFIVLMILFYQLYIYIIHVPVVGRQCSTFNNKSSVQNCSSLIDRNKKLAINVLMINLKTAYNYVSIDDA